MEIIADYILFAACASGSICALVITWDLTEGPDK